MFGKKLIIGNYPRLCMCWKKGLALWGRKSRCFILETRESEAGSAVGKEPAAAFGESPQRNSKESDFS